MTKVAKQLLYKISPVYMRPKNKRIRLSTKSALLNFKIYIEKLKFEHIKKDYSKNPSFLIGKVYSNSTKIIKNELNSYIKSNFWIACEAFDHLIKTIEAREGKLSNSTIIKYEENIRALIHDIKPFIEYFERIKDPHFILFEGWKSYNSSSFEIFKTSQALYYFPNIDFKIIDRKAANNLCLFSLRQAIELKSRRIFGIYRLYDRNGNDIRLKHNFFLVFIEKNIKNIKFKLNGYTINDILKIYKWTNFSVHGAVNSFEWEAYYALKVVDSFFRGDEYINYENHHVTSIYGGVILKNISNMLYELMEEIYNQNSNDIFCIDVIPNEAITDAKL